MYALRKYEDELVTVHDLAPLVYPSEITDVSMKIQFMLTPRALKKADRIIAISEFTKGEIMRLPGIEEERISVVYQGVDHKRYKSMDKIKCKEDNRLSFPCFFTDKIKKGGKIWKRD